MRIGLEFPIHKFQIVHKLGIAPFGDKASVTLVNNLDYIDDVTTYKTVSLALEVAAGRLCKALATSLRKINDRTNRALGRHTR